MSRPRAAESPRGFVALAASRPASARVRALALVAATLASAGAARAETTIANAWMRPAPAGAASADAYADVRVDAPATLVAVRTPAAARVDIVVRDPRDPASAPRVVDKLALPAGETRFALKGSVLRLVDVKSAIGPGAPVSLRFEFVDAAGKASAVDAGVQVRGFVAPPAAMR